MLCPQSTGSTVLSPDPGVLVSLRSDRARPHGIQADAVEAPDQGTRVSLQEHPRLLSLLNTEPFRAELKAHPVATLARHGIHLDPADVPDQVTLPELRRECVATFPRWSALLV